MQDTVKERLKIFIKSKKIGQGAFEKAVGLSNGYVNNIRKSIQPDKLQKIVLIYPEINPGWLMTGEGEMLRIVPTPEAKDWPLSESPYKELYEKERQENKELYKKIGALESELEKYRRGEVEDVSTSNIVAISPIKQSA